MLMVEDMPELDAQDRAVDTRVQELRVQYLVDSGLCPLSKMLNLLAYSKSIAVSH